MPEYIFLSQNYWLDASITHTQQVIKSIVYLNFVKLVLLYCIARRKSTIFPLGFYHMAEYNLDTQVNRYYYLLAVSKFFSYTSSYRSPCLKAITYLQTAWGTLYSTPVLQVQNVCRRFLQAFSVRRLLLSRYSQASTQSILRNHTRGVLHEQFFSPIFLSQPLDHRYCRYYACQYPLTIRCSRSCSAARRYRPGRHWILTRAQHKGLSGAKRSAFQSPAPSAD